MKDAARILADTRIRVEPVARIYKASLHFGCMLLILSYCAAVSSTKPQECLATIWGPFKDFGEIGRLDVKNFIPFCTKISMRFEKSAY